MRTGRNAALVLAALLLGGCAIQPATEVLAPPSRNALESFSLEGRFSLRHADKNYAGRLSWRHQGSNNELLLASPFGQGMAEIITNASGARLTTNDGKVFEAADAETLTRQVLGYPLPLAHLTNWVRGQASGAGSLQLDAHGRLLSLRQEGWNVDYGYDTDAVQAPPNRIFAAGADGLELRLRIDEWTALPAAEAKP